MEERSGEAGFVKVFLRGACALVWKPRTMVCEALGACLNAFTTAKGRLSMKAMLTSMLGIVVGDEETMADAIGLQVEDGELYCTSRLGDHRPWQSSGLSGKFEKSIWGYNKALLEHSNRRQISR